jgi:hypothetical protein
MIINYWSVGTLQTLFVRTHFVGGKKRIEREILQEEFAGKIVVIADVSTGTSGCWRYPLDAVFLWAVYTQRHAYHLNGKFSARTVCA